MGDTTSTFVIVTIILISWGVCMPFVTELVTGTEIDNTVDDLSDVEDSGLSFTDFAASMIKAFFWFYGELNIVGNAIKLMVNFIWAYLLIRLIRGGG